MRFSWQSSLVVYVVVGIGGAFGALARYVIMELSGNTLGETATGLLLVNVSGCALLAVVLVIGEHRIAPEHHLHHLWRPAMATGVLGGFTSTSSFAVLSYELGGAHGVMYAVFSVAAGLAAFAASAFDSIDCCASFLWGLHHFRRLHRSDVDTHSS